jgi:23S rRNA U2552 (ribose-2'-O)-methylase RlmE/FtsJ
MTTQESVGERLLRLAGYSGQGGLGKNASGIVQPIAPTVQHPPHMRPGIGFVPPQDEPPLVDVCIRQAAEWLTHGSPPEIAQADDDVSLVDDALWQRLLASKSQLDRVDGKQLGRARQRSNPYEAIKTEGYQNRAAVKIAELDAMCGGMLTRPILARAAEEGRVSHVLDLCGGPGGFTEYLATRLGWRCRFHGATLRASNDFAVARFNPAATTHTFRAYYGHDGTGDLTRADNVRDIHQRIVSEATHGTGVDLVLADGGFDVSGRENHQERLSQRLVHAQLSLGVACLAPGGHLICKLFDTVLPFTLAQMQLMHHLFEAVALVKPNQSRPANGEKYLVCRSFQGTTHVRDVLLPQWLALGERIESTQDQATLASELLLGATGADVQRARVHAYVRQRNDACARDQLAALTRMHWLMAQPVASKHDHDQQQVRIQCLVYWQLTDPSALAHIAMDEVLELARKQMAVADDDTQAVVFGLAHLAPTVPCVLHLVWFGLRGTMGHWDTQTGKQIAWGMQPPLVAQDRTIMLALWCQGVLYVVDAYCLPGLPHLYRDADLTARRRLLQTYVASCQDARLQLLPRSSTDDIANASRVRLPSLRNQ